MFVSSFTSFWDSAEGVIDTVPAVVVACFVAGADCVHPAQRIKPAIRIPDRMKVRNGDIVINVRVERK